MPRAILASLLLTLLLVSSAAAQSLAVAPTATSSTAPPVATFSNGPTQAGEWLSMNPAGVTPTLPNIVNWQWMAGGQGNFPTQGVTAGNVTFPFNAIVSEGSYKIVWWSAADTILAQSDSFTWSGTPPPPPPVDWVPMQPTAQWYVDLWQSNTGPRSGLEEYEFVEGVGTKVRSSWIKNTGTTVVEVLIPVNGGSGPGLGTQLNATIYVRQSDTGPEVRPGHENNASMVNGTSEHNAVLGPIKVWPGQAYRAFFYIGRPELWFEVGL